MALTPFQRDVCRLLAERRRASATNKVLALIGRAESRDWIDVIDCHRHLQPLGYLSWAACGKDPGFTPAGILAHAARTSHYSQSEIDALAFEGDPPIQGAWPTVR